MISVLRHPFFPSPLLPLWFLCLAAVLLLGVGDGELSAAGPQVTVQDVEGKTHAGTLQGVTAEAVTLAAQNQTQSLPTRDILELQFNHERSNPHLRGAVIFLANGDRLVAHPETIDETAALARWEAFPSWQSVRIPLETISGFILGMPAIAAVRSQALRTVLNRQQNADLVDLENGDQASGEFLGLSEKVLRLDSPVGETPIERDSIRLITMNRELISFPKTEGLTLLISLTDGSRITATDVKLENEERLTASAAFGAKLDLPVSAVMAIRPLGGRAVYLSDMEPAKYEHHPYLAGQWTLKADRNVLGEPLRLDGREYPKGLGLHSRSVVTYDLNGEYQTFRATLGVDDAADTRGSVVFAVEVDGKPVFQSDPQTAKHSALVLPPVSVQGAKQLTLRVEFAEFGDVLDYGNWADAVLIKANRNP